MLCSLLGMRFCDLLSWMKFDQAVSASVKKKKKLVYLHGVTQQHFAHWNAEDFHHLKDKKSHHVSFFHSLSPRVLCSLFSILCMLVDELCEVKGLFDPFDVRWWSLQWTVFLARSFVLTCLTACTDLLDHFGFRWWSSQWTVFLACVHLFLSTWLHAQKKE